MKKVKGALVSHWSDRTNPAKDVFTALEKTCPNLGAGPGAAQLFGGAGRDYLETYQANPDLFAELLLKLVAMQQ